MKKMIFKAALALVATGLSSSALIAQTNTFPTSGNVGIGTTSPSSKLYILGTDQTSTESSALQIDQKYIDLGSNNLLGAGTIYRTNNGSSTWNLGAINGVVGKPGDIGGYPGGLAFYTKGNNGSTTQSMVERMRIDYKGNVGIGLTTPYSLLHLRTALANPVTSPECAALIIEQRATNSGGNNNLLGSGLMFVTDDENVFWNTAAITSTVGNPGDADRYAGGLAFFTKPKGNNVGPSLAEQMRIDYKGNVGIGTSSPTARLHVSLSGTENWTTPFQVFQPEMPANGTTLIELGKGSSKKNSGHLSYTWKAEGSDNNFISLGHFGADNILNVTSGGNVGIGVTDFTNTITDFKHMFAIARGTFGVYGLTFTNNAGPGWAISLATEGQERLTVKNTGNVGIGTTSPGAKLEINNGTTSGAIKIVDGTQGAGKVLTSNADGLATWQTPGSSSIPAPLYTASDNVGIGTSSPSSKLYILGADQTNAESSALQIEQKLKDLGSNNLIGAGTVYRTNNGTSTWNLGSINGVVGNPGSTGGYPGGLAFYTKDASGSSPNGALTEQMRVDYRGNVGIGTSSPRCKLEVGADNASSTSLMLDVHGGAHFNNDLGTSDATMTHVTINTDTIVKGAALTVGGPTYIGDWQTIESSKVKADYLGTYYLWVKGGVVSEDFVVAPQTDWRDMVFNEDYKLPSLHEVEQYVKTNRHLEGIPSEAQVKESGYNMNALAKSFLEKIEHLYLYNIDQEKKITSLETINSNLKNENDKQRQMLSDLERRIAALEKK